MSALRLMLCGVPKSGTTTIHHALKQAGLDSRHHKREKGGPHLADLMWQAYLNGADPMRDLPRVQAVTEAVRTDVTVCWPMLDMAFLRTVRTYHPEAWLVLQTRCLDALVDSITRWKDLRARMSTGRLPGLREGCSDGPLREWVNAHYERVRRQFACDPRFLEIAIEDPHAPRQLEQALGMQLPWWGVKRYNPR